MSRIIDIKPQLDASQAILMDLAALPIRIDAVVLQRTYNELAAASQAFIDSYQRILVNRVTSQDVADLQVHAAKMPSLYNWHTLYLGILHSSGGTMADILQGKKIPTTPTFTPLTFIQ